MYILLVPSRHFAPYTTEYQLVLEYFTYQSAWGGIQVARTNSRFDSESSRWDNEVACLPKNSGGSIRRSHFCTSPSRKMKSARSSDCGRKGHGKNERMNE